MRCGSNPEVPSETDPTVMTGGKSGGGGGGTGGTLVIGFAGDGNTPGTGGAAPCEGDECNPTAECGDGKIGVGEGCDDGNRAPADGCTSMCKIEPGYDCPEEGEPCVYTVECGDNQVTGGEVCDDGNTDAGDGCSPNCAVEPGWSCDATGCRQTTEPAVCGDKKIQSGETCDDGNTASDDGCSDICEREEGYRCPTPGELCVADEYCGNGRITTGEQCDDGNTRVGDGCNGKCQIQPNYTCPEPGKPCVSTLICGDTKVTGNEACDDGNTADGDGCSADCKQVEPGHTCPTAQGVGGPCIEVPEDMCGDGRQGRNEFCDDGNTTPGDGCTATCVVEDGYTCEWGKKCVQVARCGDGKNDPGEECDNGAAVGTNGCTASCRVVDNWSCPEAGPCTNLVVCGDKKVLGTETCDDGNKVSNDGCSATCLLEVGWICPAGGKCAAAKCGDGIVAGTEQCDDSQATPTNGDGCSTTCQLERGWVCTTGATPYCKRTVCGDSKTEGYEQCDDGNDDPFDGCSPSCTNEPKCTNAAGVRQACSAVCGDGLVFPGQEQCDDGNTRPGDGCSATCRQEAGFTCTTAGDSNILTLPATFRDFAAGPPVEAAGTTGHPDYQWGSITWVSPGTGTDQNRYSTGNPFDGLTMGFARTGLGVNADVVGGINLSGKPVLNACALNATGSANPFLRRAGTYYCMKSVKDGTSFAQWFTDSTFATTVPSDLSLVRCIGAGNPRPMCVAGDADTFLFDSNYMLRDGSDCGANCDGFFPLDGQPNSGTGIKGADCGGSSPDGGADNHNFFFSSEVRYWFQYHAADNATLSFRGDDDVFVFVNGRLVVDIGGIHGALPGSVILNAATTDRSGTALNLQENAIYEIGVFQAERNRCASNYRLQLKNFSLGGSTCTPRCGDGVPTGNEACDEGSANVPPTPVSGTYGKCTTACQRGPFCGDGARQMDQGEECDNGLNTSTYGGGANACAPGCKKPAFCGDGKPNGNEECDDGTANNTGAYGKCSATCKLGPRCGDGVVSNGEQCDPKNDPSCNANCTLKCGDGTLQSGEQCDDGTANNTGGYGKCKSDCTKGPFCGDGFKTNSEDCDDGKDSNTGEYGTCNMDCSYGPRCGDHVIQDAAGEVCDDGDEGNLDPRIMSTYGPNLCTISCRPAPYCGDRAVDADKGERCDDGVNNGQPGSCSPDCKMAIELPNCGDGKKNTGEDCDDGAKNAGPDSECDATCHWKCGNGRQDYPDECDDGVNDGSYGTCNEDCTIADYCGDGDKNGPEECDNGDENGDVPYGASGCSTSCRRAPYCGDGRVQPMYGEQCDGGDNCGGDCRYDVPH